MLINFLQMQLGIQPVSNIPSTPEEAWNELITRISGFFIDEVSIFASSLYYVCLNLWVKHVHCCFSVC
jgi:hypothetical protein